MKKLFLLIISICVIFIISCAKGDTGPAGPAGTDGADGNYALYLQQEMYPSSSYTGSVAVSVSSSFPTSTASSALYAGIGTVSGIVRTFIKYSLQGFIPQNAVITRAYLTLYCTYSNSNTVIPYEVTRAFTSGATWNTYNGSDTWDSPGGDFSAVPAGTGITMTAGVYNNIPINASVVQQWLLTPSANYGLMLKGTNETTPDSTCTIVSNLETLSPEYRPMLKIYYRLP